jgi:pantetheine-phosphate adenylyltransferase
MDSENSRSQIWIYPGSFDPITRGHEDIIRRSSAMTLHLVVALLANPEKPECFPVQKRENMLRRVCENIRNVTVLRFDGLLVELAKQTGAGVIVRGIRSSLDFEYEMLMARANKLMFSELETLLLPAAADTGVISASLVRQIATLGGDVSSFVPACVLDDIRSHFSHR